MTKGSRITGARAISDALVGQGVRTVFSLGGASHGHLLAALEDAGVNIVSTRHESSTVAAADGYSRISGDLGVALVIADQGIPNAITGIATAYHACSPVLILVARLPESHVETHAEVDLDKQDLTASICKWSRTVGDADRLGEYVHAAAHQAQSGRPGPVILSISQAHFVTQVSGRRVAPMASLPASRPSDKVIQETIDQLVKAQRPLIVAGAGATRGRAGDALKRFANLGIPVLGNGLGRGLVPEDDELGFSWPYGQVAANESDFVLVVGARLKQRLGFGLPPRFDPAANFAQVDIHACEFNRNRPIQMPILGDAGESANVLVEALERTRTAFDPSWLAQSLVPRRDRVAQYVDQKGSPVHPLALAHEINAALPANAIYVGDGANIQNFMYSSVRIQTAPGFLDHYPLGSMGVGTPLALGAAAAARDEARVTGNPPRPVVLVTGDGSLGFYLADLASFPLADLPVVVVVGNDGAWGTERHGQIKALKRVVNTELGQQSFDEVARGLGCQGERVENLGSFRARLRGAIEDTNRSTLFDVILDKDAGALTKTDPLLSMIMFNDLATGKEALENSR